MIEGSDTRAGRTFDVTVQCPIVFPPVTFPIVSLPDLGPSVRTFPAWAEGVTIGLFTLECLARLAVAESGTVVRAETGKGPAGQARRACHERCLRS